MGCSDFSGKWLFRILMSLGSGYASAADVGSARVPFAIISYWATEDCISGNSRVSIAGVFVLIQSAISFSSFRFWVIPFDAGIANYLIPYMISYKDMTCQ
jgi:hypothetical protein